MNILFFIGLAILVFVLAIRFYARYLARQLGEDPSCPTPAQRINDGRDYVPTKPYVLFAHHFSAIAGAGPIVGPTLAILYGYLPGWLWVVFGGVFIGAVHDYLALFISMREGGKSIAEVARKTLGASGFTLFILFTILMLILVTSAFLNMTAVSLTSIWPLAKLGLEPGRTILKTVEIDGELNGRIGGIASMSVIIITGLSPFLGWLIYKRNLASYISYPLALGICIGSIVLGVYLPVRLSPNIWMIIISVYVIFAAGIPVWLILQPRDFINVQILYGGIGLLLFSLLVGGIKGEEILMPSLNLKEGVANLGLIWPMMFVMIACGAISGFHCLVAGGTSCKQVSNECDTRRIGYNAMLLESVLAVCVLLTLAVGLNFDDYRRVVYPGIMGLDAKLNPSNPVLAFSLAVGYLVNSAFGIPRDLATVFGILMIEGFVITSLDAAVRLNRYLFEELWSILFKHPPKIMRNHWFNAGLAVLLMWFFAYTNAVNVLWPIFGTANQLLAGLALIALSAWLIAGRRKYIFALFPAIFMMLTTISSLLILMKKYYSTHNYILLGMDFLLLLLSLGVVWLVAKKLSNRMKEPPG